MRFKEYQEMARETALFPIIGHKIVYPALGLAGESGEVSDKIKKIFRDKGGEFDDKAIESIAAELGDVLWYLATICDVLNIELGSVAQGNIDKLRSRKLRGALYGSGDDR